MKPVKLPLAFLSSYFQHEYLVPVGEAQPIVSAGPWPCFESQDSEQC